MENGRAAFDRNSPEVLVTGMDWVVLLVLLVLLVLVATTSYLGWQMQS